MLSSSLRQQFLRVLPCRHFLPSCLSFPRCVFPTACVHSNTCAATYFSCSQISGDEGLFANPNSSVGGQVPEIGWALESKPRSGGQVPEIQKIDLMFDQSDLVEAVSQVTWPVTPASAVHNADRIFEPVDGPVHLSESEHAATDDTDYTETHQATNLAAAAIDANLAATKAFERRAELPSNSTIQLTYAAAIAAADAMIADAGMNCPVV